jgi:putative membrane-bound dehydrogenase-like protein
MIAPLAPFVLAAATAMAPLAAPVPPMQHGENPRPQDAAGVNNKAGAEAECKIKPVEGLAKALVATYPLVDDPVSFCIDEKGRFYFAESDRQERGVEDNRSSSFWLLDDIQSQTPADRLKMYEKWASKRAGGMAYYSKYDDRIARLVDADGDGRPETRTVFAGPFNEPLDGTGAGVLAFDGDVFYTNIPNLWRLRDGNGDGVAELKVKESTGYGVRVALRGHDMHGLVLGYDGKIYWSIGDRGYDVVTSDGAHLHDPRSGAVFRMNPDGSELELFCTGLRNPQELAFDNYGNLFTGDNNSDAGDKARFVYCMEGGETGWSMDYQTLEGANQRGPWNQEGIWHLRPDLAPHKVKEFSPLQPAWTLPPLDHVGSGPSGLVFYPGLGLPERYQDHFFLCDFLGGDSYSQVVALALEPVGAGFKVVDEHVIVGNVLPTDVDFGYDGKMYMTDWGGGWDSGEKGELYAVWDPTAIKDPRIAEVTRLFKEGFASRDADELGALLAHADRRVRMRAQFELASRGRETTALLGDVAQHGADRFARIHAVWALGQQAARRLRESGALESQTLRSGIEPTAFVLPLLEDRDAEIRAQAARMLGESRALAAQSKLADLCADDSARVRAFAALALGKLGARDAQPAIVSMLADNADRDVFLRHAGVQSLAWIGDRAKIGELAAEPVASLRMASLLAMRKLRDPRIASVLGDPERTLRLEAARAINDIPMNDLRPRLAASAASFATKAGSAVVAEEAPSRHVFRRDVWKLGRVGTVQDLRSREVFARTPDESKELAVAEAPRNAGNQFIARISGVVEAPETGEYVFAVSSDDDSILFVGTSDDPASLVEVAHVDGYTNPGDFESQELQRSKPIRLEKGKHYAIQALHAEGGGGDHCAIAWTLPSGRSEQPIGMKPVDRSEFPHRRRAVEACLAEGTTEAAALLCDLALNPANPTAMRLDALDALGSWTTAAPRNRVNGAYRLIDGSARATNSEAMSAFKSVLARKLAPLAESKDAAIRSAARDVAAKFGLSLDPEQSLHAVGDASLSAAERVSSLRSLVGDSAGRLPTALASALDSHEAELRAEARSIMLRTRDARAFEALSDAVEHGDTLERQRAIEYLGTLGAAADAPLAPLAAKLVDGSLDPSLRLDLVKVASQRSDGPLATAVTRWQDGLHGDSIKRYEMLALEGGDPARGRSVVLYHTSAVCMKCHAVGGTGGNAAPALDGVASRGDARYLLHSLINPSESIAKGYENAGTSAMPPMGAILSDTELRDVVAFLKTLK